jgi:hypothetical protein
VCALLGTLAAAERRSQHENRDDHPWALVRTFPCL